MSESKLMQAQLTLRAAKTERKKSLDALKDGYVEYIEFRKSSNWIAEDSPETLRYDALVLDFATHAKAVADAEAAVQELMDDEEDAA